ncbi:MAG: hypothetical protein PHE25_06300 [Candidatus Gracilibacteria bacterium]|nr:hypothetical protein [Candidatus Gracilibacteria bacterium]
MKKQTSPFFFKISDDFHYSDDFPPKLMMKNTNPYKNPKEICLTMVRGYAKNFATKL